MIPACSHQYIQHGQSHRKIEDTKLVWTNLTASPPVLHDWGIKRCGVSNRVSVRGQIQLPLPLFIKKSRVVSQWQVSFSPSRHVEPRPVVE